MIGAIAGDIIGSKYEFNNISTTDFELFRIENTFTDDTVLTVATADALMTDQDYLRKYQWYYFEYPNRGWGGMFNALASTGNLRPYESYGNGSAMRVSPVAWYCNTLDETIIEAKRTAEVTHNHPEGIKGAQAVAIAMYMARTGASKEEIKNAIQNTYAMYDLTPKYSEYPKGFDETCQGTVALSLAIFFETGSWEEAVRVSIANGGDVDTIACIVGGIAEAYYGLVDKDVVKNVWVKLPDQMRRHVSEFMRRYISSGFVAPNVEMSQQEKMIDAMRSIFSN